MKSSKYILSLLFALSFGITAIAQTETPEFVNNDLDAYVQEAIEKWQIPGVAIGIIKDGKLVYAKGFGVEKVGGKKAVSKNTLFMIGSNSKAFTGAALALLEDQEKCKLTDPVIQWYPSLKMQDDWLTQNMNLTDIITHRIGMETFQGAFMYWGSDLSQSSIIKKFGQLTPKYEFRTKWGYCNAGYVLAGKCIEKISGSKWHSFLNNQFFNPLDMNHTYCYVSDLKNVSNVAKAHTIIDGKTVYIPYGEIDNLAPAGAISSTVEDMSHWLIMQLDNGMYNGKEILPKDVIKKTRTPYSIIGKGGHPFNTSHYNLYSLGWGLDDYEGVEIVSHTGGIDGFVTSVTMIPEENLGILVFTNTDANYFYEAVKWEILDAYLNLPFRDYSNKYFDYYKNKTAAEQAEITVWQDSVKMKNELPTDLENFEGQYTHPVYDNVTLKKKSKSLIISFQHHPNLTATLEFMGNNRFLCTYSNSLYGTKVFPFKTDGDHGQSFTLSVADFLEYTTYEFLKDED